MSEKQVYPPNVLAAVMEGASKEQSRFALSAVCFRKGAALSTDGHILIRGRSETVEPPESIDLEPLEGDALVSVESLKPLIKLVKPLKVMCNYVAVGKNGEGVKAAATDLDNVLAASATDDGKFPNIDFVLGEPKAHQGELARPTHLTVGLSVLEKLYKAAKKFYGRTQGGQPIRLRIYNQIDEANQKGDCITENRIDFVIDGREGERLDGCFMPMSNGERVKWPKP